MTVQTLIQHLRRCPPLAGVYVAVPDAELSRISTRVDIKGVSVTPGGRVLIVLLPEKSTFKKGDGL